MRSELIKLIGVSILLLSCIFSFAQEKSSIAKTKDAEEQFTYSISQIKALDKEAKTQLYSNTNTFYEYENRYKRATQILDNLDLIEKSFKELSDQQKTEKDYYIKLAYVDLACLNIYTKRNDFLNYLKISFQISQSNYRDNKAKFEDLSSKWEEKELYHLKLAKQRVNLIRSYEPSNIDASIISALLLFYEKEYDGAIKAINELVALVQGAKMENRVENFSVEEKVCMLTTWLAYIQFEKGDLTAFKSTLKSILAYNDPAENVIWAQEVLKKIETSKTKAIELSMPMIDFPKVPLSQEEISLEVKYTNGKAVSADVKSKTQIIECKPEVLSEVCNTAWKDLSVLENTPWKKAKQELDASYDKGKILYQNKNNILVVLDPKTKGYSQKNRDEFLNRFHESLRILHNFNYSLLGWSALSRLNPQIVYYRTNKIKANLGIYYINKNKYSFTDILNYYKVNKQLIPSSKMVDLKNLFDKDPLPEIIQDLAYLELNSPTNIYYLLAKAEVSMLVDEPAKALATIDEIASKIPDNIQLSELDPFAMLETYKSYVYFKQNDSQKLAASIETLKNIGASSTWIQDLNARKDFTKKEKEAIDKKYK